MATYEEALTCMCRRCMNYAVCSGTGCEPKNTLQRLIDKAEHEEDQKGGTE